MGKITKFNSSAYAVLEATTSQSLCLFSYPGGVHEPDFFFCSPTKPDFGEQDPASPFSNNCDEERQACCAWLNDTCSRQRKYRFHVGISAVVNVVRTFLRLWPSNILAYQSCWHCRRSPYFDDNSSVCGLAFSFLFNILTKLVSQLRRDVYARSSRTCVPETKTGKSERLCASLGRQEYTYPSWPDRG